MYQVLLAVKTNHLQQEIHRLHIWGETTGFVIAEKVTDLEDVLIMLRKKRYDLLILESTPDFKTIPLLRQIVSEKVIEHILIVSETVEYQSIRKSFLLGVDDYLVTPFSVHHFISLFSRIENYDHGKIASEICKQDELMELFEKGDSVIYEKINEFVYYSISDLRNAEEASRAVERVLNGVVKSVFHKYSWIEQYFLITDIISQKNDSSNEEENIRMTAEEFLQFFRDFTEMYPNHGDNMREIIHYILNHPEADLKQKTISEEMYINRSYLSTVFASQTGVGFVDYVNTIKMNRAAFLLRHTNKKIIDIAALLDYKDMGYFLKKFKAKYGVTPSQYRIPETYEFQI